MQLFGTQTYQNLSQEFYDSATSKPLYGIHQERMDALDLNIAQANERRIRLFSSDILILYYLHAYNEFDKKYKNKVNFCLLP